MVTCIASCGDGGMSDKKRNPSNEKTISLHPLTVEEALERAMRANPERVKDEMSKTRQRRGKTPEASDEASE